MDETGLRADMPHGLVLLPEQTGIDAATVARLEKYLKRGGMLPSTGTALRSPQLQRLLGVTDVRFGAVAEGHPRAGQCPCGVEIPQGGAGNGCAAPAYSRLPGGAVITRRFPQQFLTTDYTD
jgi:hypothetical protein